MTERTEASVIAELARQGLDVKHSGTTEFVVLGAGEKIETLERLQTKPTRVCQKVDVVNAASFLAYFDQFKTANSIVCVDDEKYNVRAVFDYHQAGGSAEWGSHTCTFGLTRTEEWTAWMQQNGRRMDQLKFAEFLENRMPDIVSPVGASVLEAATNLSNHRNVTFQSKVRVDNGSVQLAYIEEDKGPGQGNVEIPQQFILGIRPFLRGEAYKMTAKFRYRIADGKLEMWYDLINPDRVIRDAFESEVEKITSKLTNDTLVIYGSV